MSDNIILEENRLVKALGALETTIEKIIATSFKKGQLSASDELVRLQEENQLLKERVEELESQIEYEKSERQEIACEISNSIKQLDLLIAARKK
ncbi:MAG: hypothetical protein J0G32_00270 [Alphaproteobacteria bacterium]|nr:hypothetical protein [Alphaproteobacteria bacterium]OJV13585.1 MAG: hypothetical protein BGO27_03105 [Alphaproteobacteria bacterium 33-17]